MRHLVRAAALLVIAVVLFVGIKMELTPRSFGQDGFYRGENVTEWAGWPMNYAEVSSCQSCHQEIYSVWSQGSHQTVSCENCHGPAIKHIHEGASLEVDRTPKLCAVCHARLLSRPKDFPQIDVKEHAGATPCISCHVPHSPSLGGAAPSKGPAAPLVPHSLEGRTDCGLCHGPQGMKPFPADHAGRDSDTCLLCHKSGEK